MDYQKIGALIRKLRLEQGLTQLTLARRLNLSDKTVSKWERGLGCPDVSVLRELCAVLGADLTDLLAGSSGQNPADAGNMRRLRFYRCPLCGSIFTALGGSLISCCGRILQPLLPRPADADHTPKICPVEDELFLSFCHPMEKNHSLQFVAAVGYDRFVLVRLYPEQNCALRMPRLPGGVFYVCCGEHGLWRVPSR